MVYSVLYCYYFSRKDPTYTSIWTRRLFGTLEQVANVLNLAKWNTCVVILAKMSPVVFALFNVPTYIVTVTTFQRLVSATNRLLMTS